MTEPLLTPLEFCDFLRCEMSWVYDAVADGRLPAVRVGRLLRFRRADVDAYLDSTKTVRPRAA